MTRILTRMTSKNVSQPDPALVKLIIRKNLAEFAFQRKRSMEPLIQLLVEEASLEFQMFFGPEGSLDDYYYQKVFDVDPKDMTPYLIASGTVSILNLYQFNQYQANFVQFQTELNAQITQMNP